MAIPRKNCTTIDQLIDLVYQPTSSSNWQLRCWTWTDAVDYRGQATVKWFGVTHRAHALIYCLVKRVVLDDKCVVRTCANPKCCNVAHMRVRLDLHADGTPRNELKRARSGMKAGQKLTPDNVREIRELLKDRRNSQSAIAAKFGVSQATIGHILHGKLHRVTPVGATPAASASANKQKV